MSGTTIRGQRSLQIKALRVRDRDHDTAVSTVKLVNSTTVKNQADLLHLIANTIKNYSRSKTNLIVMQTVGGTTVYKLNNKRLAVTLGQRIASAFKHYHPMVDIVEPKTRDFCNVTVTFNA
ncbi:MAG: hypothetical protein HYV33_00035 [Candidatus Kerfeldbacteria bacterium]|nr:hypothetical protein [Candidatus Kerfeldbacteria bacterium]